VRGTNLADLQEGELMMTPKEIALREVSRLGLDGSAVDRLVESYVKMRREVYEDVGVKTRAVQIVWPTELGEVRILIEPLAPDAL
jgi:hypothetical protein